MNRDRDDDQLEKKIEKVKERLEDDFENVEEEKYSESHKISDYIWISDVYDELYELIDYYSEIDPRLKWVCMVDIMYGNRSYYPIKYDEEIREFIDELLGEIDGILQRIKKRKLVPREDDQEEFDRLFSE